VGAVERVAVAVKELAAAELVEARPMPQHMPDAMPEPSLQCLLVALVSAYQPLTIVAPMGTAVRFLNKPRTHSTSLLIAGR
jgi:PAB1-binding protein PBP1